MLQRAGFKGSKPVKIIVLMLHETRTLKPWTKDRRRSTNLKSTAITYRKIYENFYQAFTEVVQRKSYPVSNARIISAASVRTARAIPSRR